MESLYTLERFTEKYPQIKEGILQYAFTGGTGIRLNQEKTNSSNKRPISDFDIFAFERKRYPVHSFDMNERLIPLEKSELKKNVDSVKINNNEYYFMNGSFLTLSKTCAIDPPRKKDYYDVKTLYDNKQVDNKKLKEFFDISEKLNNSESSINIFKELIKEESKKNIRLFQTFPQYVNLINEFYYSEKAKEIIGDYVEKDFEKSGYSLYSIFKNSYSLIKRISTDKEKLGLLEKLLHLASLNTHVEFDRKINQEFLPQLI